MSGLYGKELAFSQKTKFWHFQTDTACRRQQEKEKLLFKSNFSFSHSVFKRLVLQTLKNQGLFGKGLKGQFINSALSAKLCLI